MFIYRYLLLFLSLCLSTGINDNSQDQHFPFYQFIHENSTRKLTNEEICDKDSEKNSGYNNYFSAMRNIYQNKYDSTCLPVQKSCGWPVAEKKLPLFVLSVGLEGAGHHLWTELFEKPLFDCVWVSFKSKHKFLSFSYIHPFPPEERKALPSRYW